MGTQVTYIKMNMITKDLKISDLLENFPGSLEVLLGVSPHFNKLQNKYLRKALAGRVTIEQAASIAKVDVEYLLDQLNKNVNGSAEKIGNHENAVPENKGLEESGINNIEKLKSLDGKEIIQLDVRPVIQSGNDPLKDIMRKVKELKDEQVLLIINSFEPIPLYTVLGKKGFEHITVEESGTFKVYFYKESNTANESTSSAAQGDNQSANVLNEDDFENIIELDVSELQPPEPMMKILETISSVDEKSVLRVFHHREPHLLYPKLEERGYTAHCTKLGEDNFKILIAKKRE